MLKPGTIAGVASVENGIVTLDGPDGVAVAMIPAAAAETGRRLIAAAELAAAQMDEQAIQAGDATLLDRDARAATPDLPS